MRSLTIMSVSAESASLQAVCITFRVELALA